MDEKVTQQKAELVKLISIHTGWIFGQHLADAENLAEAILLNGYRKLPLRPYRLCPHVSPEIRTGLFPGPEVIWQWCPDCNTLLEKMVVDA